MYLLDHIKVYEGNYSYGANLPVLVIDWRRGNSFDIAAVSILDFSRYREGLFEDKNRQEWLGFKAHQHFYDIIRGEYCGIGRQDIATDVEVYLIGCLIIPRSILHNMTMSDYLVMGSLIHTNHKETYRRARKIYDFIQTIKEAECIAK